LTPTLPEEVLPALSVQLAATDPPPPNVPELQDAIPERLSEPLAWKSTGWLYQPFESGPRESETETDGRVASYLIGPKLVWPLAFPALSVQEPENEAEALSGPAYVVDVQLARPDVPSEPLNVIPTGWLYHPLASGPRLGEAPVTVGGVESFLTVTPSCALDPFE
jgi:hypothetical protein